MIRILLVDDDNDKIAKVVKAVRDISENIYVNVVVDFVSALEYLKQSKYELLLLDMNLPIRLGEKTSLDTGKKILQEINRRKEVNSPKYLACLTQYAEQFSSISDIWPTIKYDPTSNYWQVPIINLIKHILKSNNLGATDTIKPTIFFEGKTDEKIFLESLKIFKPDLIDKVTLRSDKSAGANWVARQIIAWSYSLNTNNEKSYIKAVGLLDGDQAGKIANEEINRVIKTNSAQSLTFRTFKLSASYARHLISIKQKGVDIPVCLEEMFPDTIWEYAQNSNWLSLRNKPESFLTEPKNWNGFEITLKDYLTVLGLNEREKLYLNCFKEEHKEEVADYIMNLGEPDKRSVLQCFEKLIEEMSIYLLSE